MDTNELMKEALAYHAEGGPGKIEIRPTKPDATQYDLSLAYSPGVAAPCLAIADDPAKAYDYTIKGNLRSNGGSSRSWTFRSCTTTSTERRSSPRQRSSTRCT